jgi:hypothetical protein
MATGTSFLGKLRAKLIRPITLRLDDIATRIDRAEASTRVEAQGDRQAFQALAAQIEDHVQGMLEATDHLSVRLDRVVQLLEGIDARLSALEGMADPASPPDPS